MNNKPVAHKQDKSELQKFKLFYEQVEETADAKPHHVIERLSK